MGKVRCFEDTRKRGVNKDITLLTGYGTKDETEEEKGSKFGGEQQQRKKGCLQGIVGSRRRS